MTRPRALIMSRLNDPLYVSKCLATRFDFSAEAQQHLLHAAMNHLRDYSDVIEEHLCENCHGLREDDEETLCNDCRAEWAYQEAGMREMAEDDKAHAEMDRRAGL